MTRRGFEEGRPPSGAVWGGVEKSNETKAILTKGSDGLGILSKTLRGNRGGCGYVRNLTSPMLSRSQRPLRRKTDRTLRVRRDRE